MNADLSIMVIDISTLRYGKPMLTIPELTDARDSLRQAENIAARVRGVFLSAGYIQGARILNAAIGLLADEIAALDKAIAGGGQP